MTERQQMRNKRVDDMIKLILIREETRNMSIEDATKTIENHLSSGYEGKKEKELFIEKLTARKCRMNVVISLQFADTIDQKNKNKILKNVMDSLVNTVKASGIVPDVCENYVKHITIVGDEGKPLLHEFK